METVSILKYKDEKDRAYGLGGMVTCMYVLDNAQFIDSVSLDYDADGGMRFIPGFFTGTNQKLSAKAVWDDAMNHFQLVCGLIVANVMSRKMVRDMSEPGRDTDNAILDLLKEEGKESCELEADEVADIFYRTRSYLHKIFSHYEVSRLISDFVTVMEKERSLDRDRLSALFRILDR